MQKLLVLIAVLTLAMRVVGQNYFSDLVVDTNNSGNYHHIFFDDGNNLVFTGENVKISGVSNYGSVNLSSGQISDLGIDFPDSYGLEGTIKFGSHTYHFGEVGVVESKEGLEIPVVSITGGGNQNNPSKVVKAVVFNGEIYFSGWFTAVVKNGNTTSTGGVFRLDTLDNSISIVPGMENSTFIIAMTIANNLLWMAGSSEEKSSDGVWSFDGSENAVEIPSYGGYDLHVGDLVTVEIAGEQALAISNDDIVMIYDFTSPWYEVPSEKLGGGISQLYWDSSTSDLYVGGYFYNPFDGEIVTIAKVNIQNNEWTFIGGPYDGAPLKVFCFLIKDGKLYIGGDRALQIYDPLTGITTPLAVTIATGPNPFSDHINISMPSMEGTVQIVDLSGRIVHSEQFTGTNLTLGTAQLVPGCYFLTVTSNNKMLHSTKLVKY